jgi:hypothetical protein
MAEDRIEIGAIKYAEEMYQSLGWTVTNVSPTDLKFPRALRQHARRADIGPEPPRSAEPQRAGCRARLPWAHDFAMHTFGTQLFA